MQRVLLLTALCIACSFNLLGQEVAVASTSTLDGARFEVLTSTVDKNTTFRLDKYTGAIDRLGTCPKDDGYGSKLCWKEMVVLDISRTGSTAKPHFQIIINGPQKLTMLLQIETGRMWQFGIDPQERWFPFVDCGDKTNSNCLWRPI